MTRSNSRRFVNAAWSLLTFQLVASAGAVAVTGYAALHVRELVSGAPQMMGTVEPAVAAPDAPAVAAPEAAAPGAVTAPATQAPADSVAPAPADPASPAPAAAAAAPAPTPAVPINEGSGTLLLRADERGNIIAALTDPDRVTTRPQFQWYRNGRAVPGATGETYSVRYEDSQASIVASATYVDGHGFNETATSAPYQVGVIIP